MSHSDSTNSLSNENQKHSEESNFLSASNKFLLDTYQHPEARARQAAAVLDGCIVGGIKAIPDRIVNHPVETCNQVLMGAGTGALFGMAATIEAPVVAGALAIGGGAMTLSYAWDLGQRLGHDRDLQTSLDGLWRNGDARTYESSISTIENKLGGESFNVAIASLSGGAGAKAVKFTGEIIGPTAIKTNFCLDGAPKAVAENMGACNPIPENMLAMVWHRDRLGYEWDKIDSKKLESFIQKASLSERLRVIESAINKDSLYEAYDHAGANLTWHSERSGAYGDKHDLLSQQFTKIAMGIRNSWDEPRKGWLDQAREHIKSTREQFEDLPGWPRDLKVTPENLLNIDRLYNLPLSKRVDEIQALVNSGMLKDAAQLSNTNYVLQRNVHNNYLHSNISGSANKLYDPAIAESFDTLSISLMGTYNKSAGKIAPLRSLAEINQHLAALRQVH
ncbi:MAG TPA: hypothetical protein V6C89_02675 [Drouetiella sp.]|jgi:hypothetical protein